MTQDHIIEIVRPDLSFFAHSNKLSESDVFDKVPEELEAGVHGEPQKVGPDSPAFQVRMRRAYFKAGAHVVVDREVSARLEVASASFGLFDVPLLADAMLVSWEDAKLPEAFVFSWEEGIALSLSSKHPAAIERTNAWVKAKTGKDVNMFVTPKFTGFPSLIYVKRSVLHRDIPLEKIRENATFAMAPEAAERTGLLYLLGLVLKVLAYAAIPIHKPKQLVTRAEVKAAGVHPNRWHRPVQRVVYVPRVISSAAKEKIGEGIGESQFLGRAGHIRYYSHERYVNLRGKWQWMPPIEPPAGIKTVYVVRSA